MKIFLNLFLCSVLDLGFLGQYPVVDVCFFLLILIIFPILEINVIRTWLLKIPRCEPFLNKNKFLAWPIFVIFMTLISLPFAFSMPYPHHEGAVLYPAYLFNYNYEPLRDVFMQHPPIVAYIYGIGFKLLGEYLFVSRLITLGVVITIAFFITRIVSYFIPLWLAFLFGIFIFTSYLLWPNIAFPWPTTWCFLFILAAASVIIIWLSRRKSYFLIIGGILLGLATLCRLNGGFFAIIFFSIFIFIISFKENGSQHTIRKILLAISHTTFLNISFLCVFLLFIIILYCRYKSAEPLLFLFKFQAATPKVKALIDKVTVLSALGLDIKGFTTNVIYLMLYVFLLRFIRKVSCSIWLFYLILILPIAISIKYSLSINGYVVVTLVIAFFDYLKCKTQLEYSDKQKDIFLFLILLLLSGWFSVYPNSYTFLLILPLLVGIRLYNKWKKDALQNDKPVFQIRNIMYFFLLIVMLFLPCLKGTSYWTCRLAKDTSRYRFESGFYKYMSTDIDTYNEYTSLKTFVDKNSTKDDRILIWKTMTLHYMYLERLSSGLPCVSLDNFLYLTSMGKEIDTDLVEKLMLNPPKLVICEPSGQEKFGTNGPALQMNTLANIFDVLPKTATENSFPKTEHYIEKYYSKVYVSPKGSFIIMMFKKTG